MSFIGVAIFYVTLPEASKDEQASEFLLHAMRPTGVLVFLESISWFLLRQYRALIEDYKWFHRLYIKRANYLAAICILDRPKPRPEDMFLAAALVREDLSGKLSKGETTESIEKLKVPEESPVTEILHAASTFNKQNKSAKSKTA